MILNIRTQLDYQLHGPSSVLLQLEAALLADQNILEASIDVQAAKHFARVSGEDGIGDRIWIQASGRLRCAYAASVEVVRAVTDISQLNQVPPHLLPGDTVKYLMASRFCPADEFQNFTAAEFGHLAGGARVAAMRDWIESNFQYTSGASNAQNHRLGHLCPAAGHLPGFRACDDHAGPRLGDPGAHDKRLCARRHAAGFPRRRRSVSRRRVVPNRRDGHDRRRQDRAHRRWP